MFRWLNRRLLRTKLSDDQFVLIADEVLNTWIYFLKELPFKEDVPLSIKIEAFLPLILQRIENLHPFMSKYADNCWIDCIAAGLVVSRTHSREDMDEAFRTVWPHRYR